MNTRILVAATALFSATASAAVAQQSDRWQFSLAPYFWGASIKGQVGITPRVATVTVPFASILDHFNQGLMATFEARRGRWNGSIDGFYVALDGARSATTPNGFPVTVSAGQHQVMLQPEVGFAILQGPALRIDGLVGVRYWNLGSNVSTTVNGIPNVGASGSNDWFDGTVGTRMRFSPSPPVHFFAKGDIGTGGSKFTWQAWGGLAIDLAPWFAVAVAYRYLDVDYEDVVVNDVHMHGPALGLEFKF